MPRTPRDPSRTLDTLEDIVAVIEAKHGQGAIMPLGDPRARMQVDVVPSGTLGLDIALGIGGLPRGRIVEIYGPESSGKTTLTLTIVAEAQRLGAACAFVDAEHALDPAYAAAIGVNPDELLLSQPDYGEQALEIADDLVRSKLIDLVVVDSVAALTPKSELDGQMGDASVGLQARMMSQAMRKLVANVARTNTLVLFTNQLREKVGVMFGSPETQPGGRALKFYSSIRLDIRRIETVKHGDDPVANRVRVKVVKNKCAPPFKQAELEIEFGKGFSASGSLVDLAVENGIIKKSGAHFAYKSTKLGQGRDRAKAFIADHPETAEAIRADVIEHLAADFASATRIRRTSAPVRNDESMPAAERSQPAKATAIDRAAAHLKDL